MGKARDVVVGVFVLTLATACAPSAPPPAADAAVTETGRKTLLWDGPVLENGQPAPRRPMQVAAFTFELTGLERLEAPRPIEDRHEADFSLDKRPGIGHRIVPSSKVRGFVELESAPFVASSGDAIPGGVDAGHEELPCSAGPGALALSWAILGFERDGQLESDVLVYDHYDGIFRSGTCRGEARRHSMVRAHALVSRLAYGFLQPRLMSGREELVVMAPRASWVVCAGPDCAYPDVGQRSYGRVSVRIERGTTASILGSIRAGDLVYFLGLSGRKIALDNRFAETTVDLNVELAWSGDGDGPSGIATLLAPDRKASELLSAVVPELLTPH